MNPKRLRWFDFFPDGHLDSDWTLMSAGRSGEEVIHDVDWLRERHAWPGLAGLVILDSLRDMVFRDDECRLRTDHTPANFTTIKHIALNLTRRAPGKDSLRLRRKIAAWDDDFLVSLIAA